VYASDNELKFIDQTIADREKDMSDEELQLVKAPDDYAKKRGWGHSCYIDTANFAADANVKQLYLFHVDPNYDDIKIEELHQSAVKLILERHSNMDCHIAREGLILDIDKL